MCGKFTALASWRQVVAFSQPLTADPAGDEIVGYGVMKPLPVIVWDAEARQRPRTHEGRQDVRGNRDSTAR